MCKRPSVLDLPANPPTVLEMKLKASDNDDEQTLSAGDTATLDPNKVLDLVCTARGYPRASLTLTGPLVVESPSVTSNVANTSTATATAGLNKVRTELNFRKLSLIYQISRNFY